MARIALGESASAFFALSRSSTTAKLLQWPRMGQRGLTWQPLVKGASGIALSRRQGITHQGHFQASRAMTRAAKRGVPTLVLMRRGCRQGPAGGGRLSILAPMTVAFTLVGPSNLPRRNRRGRLSILAPMTVAFTLVGPSNLPRRKPSVINGRLDQLSHFKLSRQFTRARGRHIEWGLATANHCQYRGRPLSRIDQMNAGIGT
jgi:hypothetical protein